MHHRCIAQSSNGWEAHRFYLDTLISIDRFEEAMACLVFLLNSGKRLYAPLRDFLWHVLIRSGDASSVTSKTKKSLIQTLRRTVRRKSDRMSDSRCRRKEDSNNFDFASERLLSAITLRDFLANLLFSYRPNFGTYLLSDIEPWAIREWENALNMSRPPINPDIGHLTSTDEITEDMTNYTHTSVDSVWHNLTLFAISFRINVASEIRQFAGKDDFLATDQNNSAKGRSMSGWSLICALSALEKLFHISPISAKLYEGEYPPTSVVTPSEEIRVLIRKLWGIWRTLEKQNDYPYVVIHCVTVSFLKLATVGQDTALARELMEFMCSIDNAMHESTLPMSPSNKATLKIHKVVMFAMISNRYVSWVDLFEFVSGVDSCSKEAAHNELVSIANDVLQELVRHDPLRVIGLFTSASAHGILLENATLLMLGRVFIANNLVDLAFTCLRNSNLSESSANILLCSLVKDSLRKGSSYLKKQYARDFVDAFTRGSARCINGNRGGVVLPLMSKDIEKLLKMFLDAGYIKEASKIVQSLESKPNALNPSFLDFFAKRLVSRRHYRHLAKFIVSSRQKLSHSSLSRRPRFASIVRFLDRRADIDTTHSAKISNHQYEAIKKSKHSIAQLLAFSFHDWPLLRRFIRFRPNLANQNRIITSLQLTHAMRRSAKRLKPEELDRAIVLLSRAGRTSAALKLLDLNKDASGNTPPVTTKIGNTILSGWLFYSRRRPRIHHIAGYLANLIHDHKFIPDFVSLNLLVKAIIESKKFTATLHDMYDQLVLSVYPQLLQLDKAALLNDSGKTSNSVKSPSQPSLLPANYSRDVSRNSMDQRLSNLLRPFSTLPPRHLAALAPVFIELRQSLLNRPVSINRHVRPFLKLFANAFQKQGDWEAVRRITETLRMLRTQVIHDRIKRTRARRMGRLKAAEKMALVSHSSCRKDGGT